MTVDEPLDPGLLPEDASLPKHVGRGNLSSRREQAFPYHPSMVFVLWLTVRLLIRLLVLSDANDGTKDLEILVLRQQLRVLRRKTGRPKFTARDRVLLAAASRVLPRQRWASLLLTPQTLLRWHRTLVRRKWTGHCIHGGGRPVVAGQVAGAPLEADGPRGVREAEVGDGGDLEGADFYPAVAGVTGAGLFGDLGPWQLAELTQQAGLVVLDDQDMVGGLVGDQELGVVALGVHGIGGDDRAGKVQPGEQGPEA